MSELQDPATVRRFPLSASQNTAPVLTSRMKTDMLETATARSRLKKAIKLAEGIENAVHRSTAMRHIAAGRTRIAAAAAGEGLFGDAIRTIESITDPDEQAVAWRYVATQQAKAGLS